MDLKFYYHKYNYWVKQFLAVIIIVSTIFRINNASILIQRLWIGSSVPFFLLSIAGLIGQLSVWRIALTINENKELDLAGDTLQLAQDMGSSISAYFPGKDLSTAFLWRGKKLVIGENVTEMLSGNELLAILAHEFSHDTRKGIHNKVQNIGVGLTLIPVLLLVIRIGREMESVAMVVIACCYLFMSILFWYVECDCDANAVKYVPIDDFASALTKVYEGKYDSFSFLHPSLNFRINRLRKRT